MHWNCTPLPADINARNPFRIAAGFAAGWTSLVVFLTVSGWTPAEVITLTALVVSVVVLHVLVTAWSLGRAVTAPRFRLGGA